MTIDHDSESIVWH